MAQLVGTAQDQLEPGDYVLCRDFRVSKAPPALANAIAKQRCGVGQWASLKAVEGLGERDLHAMANGPIMEPLRIYLPAGKLSEDEYQERLALDFGRAGIERT